MMIANLEYCLPLHLYGKGEAKSFSRLIAEIEAGETAIEWQDNKPIRVIKVARVDVRYGAKHLVEVNQIFSDGRSRQRNIRGVSEKFFAGESPSDAAVRGIKEELGLDAVVSFVGVAEELKESPSYPGLTTKYEFHDFICYLDAAQYKPQYVADEGDSTTYFEWRE